MPNQYFQFKQFIIQQDKCAMKVTTDGCLFGAVVASVCAPTSLNNNVLDIGTGTGLLSLMYAQQHGSVLIDAVEIDEAAASQAIENFAASPWTNRLQVNCTSLQKYATKKLYDIIITNPPFYEKQLVSGNSQKDSAHHSTELSLHELLAATKRLLTEDGMLAILLPFYREDEALQLALTYGLKPWHIINLRQTPKHTFFRSILMLKQHVGEITTQEITIREEDAYSAKFIKLLHPYYLYL